MKMGERGILQAWGGENKLAQTSRGQFRRICQKNMIA